jgi:hypothetical protein
LKLLALGIIFGAALVAGAILVSGRYSLERANNLSVWRVDQLTGDTRICIITAGSRRCSSVPNAPVLSDKEVLGLPDDLVSPKEVKP